MDWENINTACTISDQIGSSAGVVVVCGRSASYGWRLFVA